MDEQNRRATDRLAKLSSERTALAKSSGISEQNFSVITTWVTMVCHHKRMEVPDEQTFRMTWLEPLKSYRPAVIDAAFRDYLQTGAGEFFDIHAITGRCNAILARNEGDRPAVLGCELCRRNGTGNGFVWTDVFRRKLEACPCREDASLRTPPPPKPEEFDRSDFIQDAQRQLAAHTFPPEPKPHPAPIAPPASAEESQHVFEEAVKALSPEARRQVEEAMRRTGLTK